MPVVAADPGLCGCNEIIPGRAIILPRFHFQQLTPRADRPSRQHSKITANRLLVRARARLPFPFNEDLAQGVRTLAMTRDGSPCSARFWIDELILIAALFLRE